MFLDNLKFFKTPRHKQFNYQPRYWDPEKEEFEKRVEAAKQEAAAEARATEQKDYSKDALRDRIDFRSQRPTAKRPDFMTNVRVLMIAGILAAVLYFVYTYL